MFIYKTTNLINGKIYIGKRSNIKYSEKYLGSGVILRWAIEKYGRENFIREILEDGIEDRKILNEREIYWIKFYDSMNLEIGYNLTPGGEGFYPTEEILKRLSDALMGHEVSEETRKKISESNKGKVSQFKGKKHTEESKEKNRQSHLGMNSGKDNVWYGTHLTEETRIKMSENHADISGSSNFWYGKSIPQEYVEKSKEGKRRNRMEFNSLFPLQTVINLDQREDRLKLCMEEEFPSFNMHPIRKPGILFTEGPNPWWNGAIGCMLSHLSILKAAMYMDVNVFIFEDDIKFIKGKHGIRNAIGCGCEELKDLDWDMFYLGANILKPFNQVTPHLAKLNFAQSTCSYGVNKKFIPKLLSYFDLNNIVEPIDMTYATKVIPNCNAYITVPIVAIQRDSFSDIEQTDVNYSSYLEKRYWDNLIKL
jgi:group I intron endonuclease